MKRFFVLVALLVGAINVNGQEATTFGYSEGQNFIGANMAFGRFSDYSGVILGANYGHSMNERLSLGIGANFVLADIDDDVNYPVFSITPFARYNIFIDGPVAVFGQANIAVAMMFYDSASFGVIWPNISGGLSYRLSEHFTAFAQMGLISLIAIPFGSVMRDSGSGSGYGSGSGSGSGSGYYPYDDWGSGSGSGSGSSGSGSSSDSSGLPIAIGFTRYPTLGIYFTF